ncbi:MAG TPA: C39 family peptidase [Nocardioidaceae bacterium]|nr:C39 family peptidase [Nocardioidaceae bacterium]
MNRHIRFTAFASGPDFARGTHQGTQVSHGTLVFGSPAGTLTYRDPFADSVPGVRTPGGRIGYEWAAWVSPQVEPGFGATSLIASWNASTPSDSWLAVEIRTSADGVAWSQWYSLGRWAQTDAQIHPTSAPGQDDANARARTDLLDARDPAGWSAYQLRVVLLRPLGSTSCPQVRLLGAMASRLPRDLPASRLPASPPGPGRGVELDLPAYSQQLHRGRYPHWDSGGGSWCSPTSTSMALGRWDRGPNAADYTWVDDGPDPWIVHAARRVFDYAYRGAGNWAFNTAYAAGFGTTAFVTRLRSLAEAELFVAAGIPVVATLAFGEGELAGSGYATHGHLLVIAGFDERGDVICHDPASHGVADNREVRTVYDRAEFERLWLAASGGVVYVIRPVDVPLPDPPEPEEPNW